MPELPDVEIYRECLERFVAGRVLERIRFASPFVLRSVDPGSGELEGRSVEAVRRLGKRIVLELDGERYVLMHLMIAGRLRWNEAGTSIPKGRGLAAFDFPNGTLLLTEAGKKRRASIHLLRGAQALAEFDRGGLEVIGASERQFCDAMRRENHTLKRALTDPRILSGVGNAYSDEILHLARLSPFKQTHSLGDEEWGRLYTATVRTLVDWTERLRTEARGRFPEKVTAFRDGMAVHGRYRQPCPDCGAQVQRIVYAGNEANYCARCQTGGKVLADRALSRLLKANWPRTLEELEQVFPPRG